jgi:hypothetical protein
MSQFEDDTNRVNDDNLESCDTDNHYLDTLFDSKMKCNINSPGTSKDGIIEDALRSDLYSSTLDLLRETLSSYVPSTEEMISRAIIYAFSDESGPDQSAKLKGMEQILDVEVVEADVLGETFAWLQWNRNLMTVADQQDRNMEFFRKQVEWMVFRVRHSRLDVVLASQILHRVATLLNMELAKQPNSDTLIIWNLKPFTLAQDLINVMQKYGKVTNAALSQQFLDFGTCICRNRWYLTLASEFSYMLYLRLLSI